VAKKIWSPARDRRLLRMYESGKFSTSEMAEKLEASIPTVYNHLRRMGLKTTVLPRRHRAAVKFEFSNSEKRQIIELAREGHKVVIADNDPQAATGLLKHLVEITAHFLRRQVPDYWLSVPAFRVGFCGEPRISGHRRSTRLSRPHRTREAG